MFASYLNLPEFSRLSETNRLNETDESFLRTYSCLKRERKGALEGLVSVLAADYALFFGAYTAVIWIAAWIQKGRRSGGTFNGLQY